MAQTDKTDKTKRSTYWSVTAFKEEIATCRDGSRFPAFVEDVDGQTETCPNTGTIHFQGIIKCSRQVRLSAFKSWLPTAHLEPAKSVPALKNYVKKSETSNGDYQEVKNDMPHYAPEEILEMLGEAYRSQRHVMEKFIVANKFDNNAMFYHLLDIICEEKGRKYVRLFMNPIIKTMFCGMKIWRKERSEEGPLVLQAPPPNDSDTESEE